MRYINAIPLPLIRYIFYLKGVVTIDLRAGFAGVLGLFSTALAKAIVLRKRFLVSLLFVESPGTKGFIILGDFSFLPFVIVDFAVDTYTLASFFASWKNSLADGDPNTNDADLSRAVGLNTGTSACLSTLLRLAPTDLKKEC